MVDRFTSKDALRQRKWSMAAFNSWELANDGARTHGGGIVGDIATAEPSSELAKAFDASEGAGTWGEFADTNGRAGYTAVNQFFPDAPAQTDAFALGNAVPFCEFALGVEVSGTQAVYNDDGVLAWEYSDGIGSWASLTLILDNTESGGGTGDRAFGQDGAISFIPPSDWVSVDLDGDTAYWIRAVIQNGKAANLTTVPVMDLGTDGPGVVTPSDGFTCPSGRTITGLRVIDSIAEGGLHAGTDVKFILMNFTTGDHSGELTWATGQRQDSWSVADSNFTAFVGNKDDVLGVLVTQEDNGDPENVMLEIQAE